MQSKLLNSGWVLVLGYPWSDKYLYGGGQIIIKFHENGKKVLWVNPIPNKGFSLGDGKKNKTIIIRRLLVKVIQQLKLFQRVKKKFYTISPIYIPILENSFFYNINKVLIYLQVKLFSTFLRIKNPIICTMGTNDVVSLIKSFDYIVWFHNAGDLYQDLRGISSTTKRNIYELEKKIFDNSDLVLAASQRIFQKIQLMIHSKSKVLYFPHGADYQHFSKCLEIDDEIKKINKPIAGYFGSLTEANNQEVYIALAKSGINVVLIGKLFADYSECKKYENIYFIDAVAYSELPKYANYFNVGLLAWKPAEWIDNCNPKKTYEYLSMGLPIVSIPIPQLVYELNDLIYFAETPEEFVKQVYSALKNNSPELRSKRIEKASSQSWDVKFLYLLENLEKHARYF